MNTCLLRVTTVLEICYICCNIIKDYHCFTIKVARYARMTGNHFLTPLTKAPGKENYSEKLLVKAPIVTYSY